ncbi:MAG: M56 family metallopeptidase, partial [Clostridiales bacterium]|nr:M56 family metallopeptidase [Clostridiales bacterium]
MTDLFLKVLEMSIIGSVVVLATILFRFLLRKRSKRFIMILWAVVAVRFLLPLNIQSVISIFNYIPLHTDAITMQIQEAKVFEETFADAAVADSVAEKTHIDLAVHGSAEDHAESTVTEVHNEHVRAVPEVKTILASVWFIGFATVASYAVIRFILLKIKLKDAVKIDKNVFESEKVSSPFVFGLFVPKIYLPEVLENTEREYILMHERTHIRHGDWIGKILGTVIVAIHWFNPFVWLSYALFEQDIEMSCDESTISKMTSELKQAYAISIVNYAKRSNNKKYLVTPLGFSNGRFCKTEVTHRVKNIISYKKGTKFTSALIVATLLFVAATLGLNSKNLAADELLSGDISVQRNAPFNYTAKKPEINSISITEKQILFNRDGKTINGKIKTPEGEGPFKTIILCKALDLQGEERNIGYEKISDYFN